MRPPIAQQMVFITGIPNLIGHNTENLFTRHGTGGSREFIILVLHAADSQKDRHEMVAHHRKFINDMNM
jgi:hypothetical protein